MTEYKGGLLKLISRAINSSTNNAGFVIDDTIKADNINGVVVGEKFLNHFGCMFISVIKHTFKHSKVDEYITYCLIKGWTNQFNKKAVLNEFNLNSDIKKMQILYNDFCSVISYTDKNKLDHLFECHEFFNKLLAFTYKLGLDYKDLIYNVLKTRRK